MHNHGSAESRLQVVLMPNELVRVQLISFKHLLRELGFCTFVLLLLFCVGLLLSSSLCLILQVESNRLLEVNLHSATLVLSAQGIHNFDVNLGAVKRAISMVVGPGLSKSIQSLFKRLFGHVPLFFCAELFFRTSG
jgi:hypothetical protein